MRSFLIACVLLLTVLTFYSALWFKSESIEADITNRVTDDLEAAGADGIEIDVDGRHVTLSGVVYDDATEQSYLETADATYGALGPIDGLTQLGDNGFLTAIKTADGISLRGTVANEDQRAALVAEAEAATEGAVDDQLVVSGPAGDWQSTATVGLAQMAGLSSGTLSASGDTLSLSGVASGDADAIAQALTDQGAWNVFVSDNAQEMALTTEVERLTGDVTDLTARLDASAEAAEGLTSDLDASEAALEALTGQVEAQTGEIADLNGMVDVLTGERDTAIGELADLRASLSAGEADTANLAEQLAEANASVETAQTVIAGQDTEISTLTDEISALTAENVELEGQLASRSEGLSGAEAMIATLTATLDTNRGEAAELSGQVEALSAENAELTSRVGVLEEELAVSLSNDGDVDQRIAELQDIVDQRDASIEGADTLIASLTGNIGERDEQISNLSAQVDDLTGQVADRDTTIEGLTADIEGLRGTVTERDTTIADLTATLQDRDTTIAGMTGTVEDQGAALAETDTRIADLEANVADRETQIAGLDAQVTDLTAVVAERDATIAALRQAQPAVTGSVAEQCAARAGQVLENSRINFRTATATISNDSREVLERLTGIALACVGSDVQVEIGGHTDSQGTDENNQALSEARAQAVLAFMAERGVPTAGLVARGYGESQPIADNDTAEGRAENRRISFDWQAR